MLDTFRCESDIETNKPRGAIIRPVNQESSKEIIWKD